MGQHPRAVSPEGAVTEPRQRRPVLLLVQFLPLWLFATYAFWGGRPGPERWKEAFVLGAAAAAVQLILVLPRRPPINRLVVGADVYLLVGGAATLARRWEVLELYGVLGEAGVFASTTHPDRPRVRVYSLYLLALTAAALGVALALRGNQTWAAVAPLVALAVADQYLAHRPGAGVGHRPLEGAG